MSLGTVDSEPTESVPKAAPPASPTTVNPNDEVISAIRAHHEQLVEQLRIRTDAVLAAARAGDCAAASKQLHDWYRKILIPHAVAEESTLYSVASEVDSTRLLVRGMLAEHRFLVGQIADLALAADPVDVATTAAAAQAVFAVHLDKENELLLPALDQAGADLSTILDGMHEILGRTEGADPEMNVDTEAGPAGCDCGCSHGGPDANAVALEIGGPPAPVERT